MAFFLTGASAPAAAQDPPPPACNDNDGDGWVVDTGSCTIPDGKLAGDCNDANASIHPGAAERCDGIDNNCSGVADEGFNVGAECGICDGPGCPFGFCVGADCDVTGAFCLTQSIVECSADGSSSICPAPSGGLDLFEAEGGGSDEDRRNDLTCFDGGDNDCDDLPDHLDPDCQTAEICDGFDNDGDLSIDEDFDLGASCSAGVGACRDVGVSICSPDGAGTQCGAVAGAPRSEGPFGSATCSDGIDNDCDGLTDFPFDDSCTGAELCDGIDNDGDGVVDNGFLDVLGTSCSVGVGSCESFGQNVCSVNGATTACSVIPSLPGVEGPGGSTCRDGIDNDCDGSVDLDDPNCASAAIHATCALPLRNGTPLDCSGIHTVEFETFGHGPDADVTAELLAIDHDGSILDATPVQRGDTVELRSHSSFGSGNRRGHFVVFSSDRDRHHKIYAPVAMLRIKVNDGLNQTEAFCSNVPYLRAMEPDGAVVSQTEGNTTKIVAAAPLVETESLFIKVDGVDVLGALGIADPSTCTVDAPCGGIVSIGGSDVAVSDLTVESAPAVGMASSNSVRMTLDDLGCGGHVFVVDGVKAPGATLQPSPRHCTADDVRDRALSSVFGIDIAEPLPLQSAVTVPTRVVGEACHGRAIEDVRINGQSVDLSAQSFFPGDGEDTADTYKAPFEVLLGQTDLARDITAGDTPLGTFDAGSNRLIADGVDDLGNRTFTNFFFATGDVAPPGGPSAAAQVAFEEAFEAEVEKQLSTVIRARVETAATTAAADMMAADVVEIDNAFVAGLTSDAISSFFQNKCSSPDEEGKTVGQKFSEAAQNALRGKTLAPFKVPFVCACDPTVFPVIESVFIDPDGLSCPVLFPTAVDPDGEVVPDGRFRTVINLPDVAVTVAGSGSCKTKKLGICISKARASFRAGFEVRDIRLKFDITEEQLMGARGPDANFNAGLEAEVFLNASTSVGCIGGAICDGLFNLVGIDVTPDIDVSSQVQFAQEIGQGEPDPIELDEIKVDEEEIEGFNQTLRGDLFSVDITSEGILASLKGRFATQSIDPEVQQTPGALLTPAPAPVLPVPNADDAFLALADDTFNQLFASMTASGRLNLGCRPTGKTVSDLLPADCDSIQIGSLDAATAVAQGLCHGVRQTSCETLDGGSLTLTGLKQGTCHGIQGNNCETIFALPFSGERATCRNTAPRNLNASQPLLFCVRQDVPPALKIVDDAGTPAVETALRLNDLSVALLVDRQGDGLDGQLSSTSACFGTGAPTVGDCNLFGLCMDLNFDFNQQFQTCTDGKPGFVTQFRGLQILNRQVGVVCGAANAGDDESLLDEAATDDTINFDLGSNVDTFSPPICARGFTLGGLVSCTMPKLIAIDTDGSPDFQDYLGVTCEIVP